MKKIDNLHKNLKRGNVYRRADLARFSSAVDRHLAEMVGDGTLLKLSQGLYYFPRQSAFGPVPPDEATLVKSFLKDGEFLITSPNAYNSLGVGTTQLYNKRVVYNHKRHGEFELGGTRFSFVAKPRFPKKATPEFLLVDLVNNIGNLAEDPELMMRQVQSRALSMDAVKLKQAVRSYGGVKAKKIFAPLLSL
ncbi:hypothetical protein D3C87_395120 [compost metagenome]